MSRTLLARKRETTSAPAAKTPSGVAPPGLRIGKPHDSFEQEADRAANEVSGGVGRSEWSLSGMSIEAQPRKTTGGDSIGEAPSIVGEVLSTPGRPLEAATRELFEPRFGHDFGGVRVHAGGRAAESTRAVQARAYTVGSNVVFGEGQYRPQTPEGRRLIAHELAHVVQQDGATRSPMQSVAMQRDPDPNQKQPAASQPAPGAAKTADPAPATDQPKQDAKAETQDLSTGSVRTRVRKWLDQEKFSVELIRDDHSIPPEQWHAFYEDQRWTLARITDETFTVLQQLTPELKRGDVWSEVYQYYQQKEQDLPKSNWVGVAQLLWTPTYNIASNQPGPRVQGPGQVTLGKTYQAHKQGAQGLEHQFALSVSGLDFLGGQKNFFENALLSYQLSDVLPLGKDFQIGGTWANLQASLNAQAAAGLGAITDPKRGGKMFFGLLVQPGAGGQISLNIGSFSIIASGTVVYSWASKTDEAGSKSSSTLGFQGGVGIGGNF